MRSWSPLFLLFLAAGTGAEVVTREDPIIDGKIVGEQEQQLKGLVSLAVGCSAVLIANDWLLTAGHCIGNVQNATSVTATANWGGGQTRTSDAIYQFGEFRGPRGSVMPVNPDPRGPDLALVHLSRPFTVNGSQTGFSNKLYAGSLTGSTVASYGRGIGTLPGAGSGIWRAADLVVASTDGESYTVNRNSQRQIGAPGDSGGPGFLWENNVPYITGIQSGCSWDRDAAGNITAIYNCTMVSMPAVNRWIYAVLATQWSPNQTSGMRIDTAERIGTRWGFTDLMQVHWAQAARSAAAACYNRGFAGGHFNGQLGANGFSILCTSQGTIWRDVTAAEIAATEWRFDDINQVNWAQANRAAERLCAAANQNFAGGHFNGHMANGRFGLVCYGDNAKWFDATDAELVAIGHGLPTPRLDDVAWADAVRAATQYCRARGFMGGFMNGHQVPGRYGIVCQN
jgi:trypsin